MMTRTAIALTACLLIIGGCGASDPSGEVGTTLAFGWIGYLSRVSSEVTIRWDGIAIFAGTLAASAIVAHLLFSGLFRELKTRIPIDQPRWRFRWTVGLLSTVILIFAAGTAMVGITHQVVWLLTAEEPLYARSLNISWTDSKSNLKSLGIAVLNTSDVQGFPARDVTSRTGEPQSWVLDVLPYVGAGYEIWEIDTQRAWNDPANAKHFRSLIPELLNPSFRNAPLRDGNGFGLNHYAGNSEMFDRASAPAIDDGPSDRSNLLLIGEVNSEFVAWGRPDNSRHPAVGINTPGGFGGAAGSDGALFVMADGSVRLINKDIDPRVLESLSRPMSEANSQPSFPGEPR
jgi:hypothetical protein